MKKVVLGLIILALLGSCKKTPEIFDLNEFCEYTVDCYKNYKKSNAIELQITKNEVTSTFNSMKLPSELKKYRLAALEKQDKEGYFDKENIEKKYLSIRSVEDEDFWKNCTIEGYDYMETDKWYGYEMAEPIVILKQGDYTANFKIGELIKTDNGWKIIQGPTWK